jgi:hypothetical protein
MNKMEEKTQKIPYCRNSSKIQQKNNLNMSVGLSETINKRRSDNIMTKTKKNKRKINDLQNITQKIKDRATRTPLKARDKLRCSGRVGIS